MAKKKQKYYVVWVGAVSGVYKDWDSCNAQIRGYPVAKFKSFKTLAEANEAFGESPSNHIVKKGSKPKKVHTQQGIIRQSLSVDAACSGSPGIMEYQGVWTHNHEPVFHKGPFSWGTNNVGEFLALVHGIAFLKKRGMHDTPIYSDSRTALSWLRNKQVKTTLEKRSSNQDLFELLHRAEQWTKKNTWTNPVLKWETKKWGEIPADFGRK